MALKLILAATYTKLLPKSWLNYHGVLPLQEEDRRQILGSWVELLNYIFEWELVHAGAIQEFNRKGNSIFIGHLDFSKKLQI